MENDTETNFGWWSDRPERVEPPSQFATQSAELAERHQRSVWKEVALIVVLFTTLAISVAHFM